MMSSPSSSSSIPKWQIALGVGTAGAIGLTLWYFRHQQQKKIDKKTFKSIIDKTISIDDNTNDKKANKEKVDGVKKDLTPLERAQEYKTKGNELFKMGKYDEAINFYNLAIEICPKEKKIELSTYYQNRAACYENLKNYEMVIKDCTSAIELNQRYEKALMRRAKIYEILKDWENCLDDITSVCLLQQFQNQVALLMADRVLKELGKKHAQEEMQNKQPIMPSQTFIKTYFSSFSEDPVYKKLLDTTTEEPLGQGDLRGFQKAKLAYATEKYDEIIPACTEEINTSESESLYKMEAFSLRASFYFLKGQFSEALNDLTTIIENDIADSKIKVNALIKRASILMQQEKIQECLDDFNKAAEIGPNISDVYHHRGQIQLLLEHTKEAVEDFHKAVELNPNFPIAYIQKCYSDYRLAMQQQNFELLMASLDDFRKSLDKFPNCIETYILYGQVLTEKQDFQQAENCYKKALEIDPKNASIYVHRGLLNLQWKGDIDAGVRLMNEAIRIDEKSEFAYETLGTVEVQRGNLLVAIELFNKAIKLARSEMEITHLFSLRDAAMSQLKVTNRLGIDMQFMNKS